METEREEKRERVEEKMSKPSAPEGEKVGVWII